MNCVKRESECISMTIWKAMGDARNACISSLVVKPSGFLAHCNPLLFTMDHRPGCHSSHSGRHISHVEVAVTSSHVENGASFLVRRDDTTDNMTAHGGEILNAMHASALDSHPRSTQIGIDNHTRTTDDVGAEHVSSNVDEISPEDNRSAHHDWHHRTPQVCGLCSSAQLSCSLNVLSLCLPDAISSLRSRTLPLVPWQHRIFRWVNCGNTFCLFSIPSSPQP